MTPQKTKTLLGISACVLVLSAAWAEVKPVAYEKWNDCLEITNGTARVVIAPSAGGRIVHYSRDGGPNFFAGGCQIDIGPELDYPPRHQALWAGPYQAEQTGPLSVRLLSAKDTDIGLQITRTVEMAESGATVAVRQTMTNISTKDVAYCHWDRTMTRAQYGFFELNSESRFPAKWSVRLGENRSYSYDGKTPSSPRVQIVGDWLVVVPGKKMEKVGADSAAGWIAGYAEGWLYVKRFPYFPDGDYADGGNSVEIWVDAAGTRMEIEPLSPKVKLKPGESYPFEEQWDLQRVDEKIESAADIPKLLPYVRKMARPGKQP